MQHPTVSYKADGAAHVTVPAFNARYIRALFSMKSAPALLPLFHKAGDPAKEWTESFSAYSKLRRYLREPTLAVHVGDGAHARTGAIFAFNSGHTNVSVDPVFRQEVIDGWYAGLKYPRPLERLAGVRAKWQDVLPQIVSDHIDKGGPPVLLTFVHAHVDVMGALASLPKGSWRAAYTCACCEKAIQLLPACNPVAEVVKDEDDWAILSPERHYQLLVPKGETT